MDPSPVTTLELRALLEDFVAAHPDRGGQRAIWRKPLLASAAADRRFDILPRIASPDHLLPKELLPTARSVVVFFIPFKQELAAENLPGKLPARSWGEAYVATNQMIGEACRMLSDHLAARGHNSALTPATHNFDPAQLMSRWSHKHLGHIAGLGRFGHNSLFITPKGCVGRMGSLVTEAELGDAPLIGQAETCLHRAGQECLKCVARCPVGALTDEGYDRRRCWDRLVFNIERSGVLDGLPGSTHVCAKCAMDLPCSHEAPVKA